MAFMTSAVFYLQLQHVWSVYLNDVFMPLYTPEESTIFIIWSSSWMCSAMHNFSLLTYVVLWLDLRLDMYGLTRSLKKTFDVFTVVDKYRLILFMLTKVFFCSLTWERSLVPFTNTALELPVIGKYGFIWRKDTHADLGCCILSFTDLQRQCSNVTTILHLNKTHSDKMK